MGSAGPSSPVKTAALTRRLRAIPPRNRSLGACFCSAVLHSNGLTRPTGLVARGGVGGTGGGEGGGEESRGMKHLRRGTADLVDSFPVAAVTNYHKPSGLNHTNLLPHGSGTTSTTRSVHSLARTSSMVTLSWEMKVCGPETGSQPVVSVACHGTTSLEETGSFQMETNRCFAIKHQE